MAAWSGPTPGGGSDGCPRRVLLRACFGTAGASPVACGSLELLEAEGHNVTSSLGGAAMTDEKQWRGYRELRANTSDAGITHVEGKVDQAVGCLRQFGHRRCQPTRNPYMACRGVVGSTSGTT
eukprot:scaffold1085_cov407-Prasinococcus_capsulatus_cf.AAC.23